ncbi:MAG: 1-acyl-sn-glycerol-3-phosphate acyltransferase [Frankiaceae bacterium]|nr:1-acyl-sn-glycerol-3-phosphate acyltransferase [Frankiaceae bacterium]
MSRRASRAGLPTVRGRARGWRWGSRPLVPASAEPYRPLPAPPREFSTEWARTPAVRSLRALAQSAALKPLIWSEVSPTVSGLDHLTGLRGPVIFAANHSSHLDAPLVLCSLPPAWRHQTLVAAAADYFFDDWWRAFGTALVFGTVPLDRTGGATAAASPATPHTLLTEGWSLLFFPEGTRAPDGQMAGFKTGAARMALAAGVPIVPIGIRGSFAAMPRGRSWPVSGRPQVSVRYGAPMRPLANESAKKFTTRLAQEIRRLDSEDRSSWWSSLREPATAVPSRTDGAAPAHWRQVWASTEPVPEPGRSTPWD